MCVCVCVCVFLLSLQINKLQWKNVVIGTLWSKQKNDKGEKTSEYFEYLSFENLKKVNAEECIRSTLVIKTIKMKIFFMVMWCWGMSVSNWLLQLILSTQYDCNWTTLSLCPSPPLSLSLSLSYSFIRFCFFSLCWHGYVDCKSRSAICF